MRSQIQPRSWLLQPSRLEGHWYVGPPSESSSLFVLLTAAGLVMATVDAA